jgi:phosphoribosylaminoimidazole-succinocarboxamide synthase
VERGLVDPTLWDQVTDGRRWPSSHAGRRLGEQAGLILADTKYEFGLTDDGELMLIDEVHTPDSSRWWVADGYEERLAAGEEPESLDKEVVRRAFADLGYRGDGPVPEPRPDDVWTATTAALHRAYERLTGTHVRPGATLWPTGSSPTSTRQACCERPRDHP